MYTLGSTKMLRETERERRMTMIDANGVHGCGPAVKADGNVFAGKAPQQGTATTVSGSDVQAQAPKTGTIQAGLFVDRNGNGVQDNGESTNCIQKMRELVSSDYNKMFMQGSDGKVFNLKTQTDFTQQKFDAVISSQGSDYAKTMDINVTNPNPTTAKVSSTSDAIVDIITNAINSALENTVTASTVSSHFSGNAPDNLGILVAA